MTMIFSIWREVSQRVTPLPGILLAVPLEAYFVLLALPLFGAAIGKTFSSRGL
jgi:hypothetical protein